MKYKPRLCPQCKSRLVRRSHRYGFFESVILPLLALRPYRCEDCYFRYAGSIFRSRRFLYVASRIGPARVLGFASLAALLWALSMWPEVTIAAGRWVSSVAEEAVSEADAQPTAAPEKLLAHVTRVEGRHNDLPYLAAGVMPMQQSLVQLPLARDPIGALQATGQVFIGDQPVAGEATVFVGDTVRTAAGATATLRLPEEGILTIGSDTQVGFFDGAQFSADLQRGTVGLRVFGTVRRSRIRVGRYVVVAVPNQNTVGAIRLQPNGATHFVCSEGSFGVIALESSETVFLSAGEEADLSPDGRVVKRAASQTAGQPPPAAPPVKAAGGGGSRTALVILGVGGGAGAVAALALGKGSDSVSPSAP